MVKFFLKVLFVKKKLNRIYRLGFIKLLFIVYYCFMVIIFFEVIMIIIIILLFIYIDCDCWMENNLIFFFKFLFIWFLVYL